MKLSLIRRFLMAAAMPLFCAVLVADGADWPMWGQNPSRNMVSSERELPAKFALGEADLQVNPIDLSKSTNLKWVVPLGSQSYGNPTVAGGRVYVGTNNDPPKVPSRTADYGVVLCLEEQTGKLVWQLTSPKLRAGDASDFEHVGNCSSPAVDEDRVFVVTNRCEIVCLDVHGLANGNDGEFKDEAKYIAGPGESPAELLPNDADILWCFDMRDELGVFPHQMTSSSVLVIGDRIYVTTSNGTDWTNVHIPSPNAPALVCLDKRTGKLLGEERSGISSRTFRCNWSSPSYGQVNGRGMIFFGGDDGFCYAFAPEPVDGVLKEIWRIDCNPPEYRMSPDGKPIRFGQSKGPNGILATPVFYEGKVFLPIGQDPGQGDGAGALVCIDAATGKQVWITKSIGRSISTPAIADGLMYVADYGGKLYCINVSTGQEIWKHDCEGTIWGSPLLADGKVYVGTENLTLWVLAASGEKKVLGDVILDSAVLSSPVAANGVLYIMTGRTLYAAVDKPQ